VGHEPHDAGYERPQVFLRLLLCPLQPQKRSLPDVRFPPIPDTNGRTNVRNEWKADIRFIPAQPKIRANPQAIIAMPAILAIQRPPGSSFSPATSKVSPAIQTRFMTPPTNSSAISNQQQPTQ
jgi:hypothetical protein